MPRVSVIIPVHNRESMIGQAIESVLAQSMGDFELIVVDDGSTDRTAEVVEGMEDRRIRLVRHDRNRGTPSARNSGLAAASGEYIAWLDSDDLARPYRLAVQTEFLDSNPSIALVGGEAATIGDDGRPRLRRRNRRPASHEEIAATLLFRSPVLQSSMMGRAEVLKQYPYRLEFPVCQDLDMYSRLVRHHRVANMRRVLIDRRLHADQVVHKQADRIVDRKRVLFREALLRLGIDPTDEELQRHIILGRPKKRAVDRHFLDWSRKWLTTVVAANAKRGIYDERALELAVRRVWRRACFAGLRGPDRLHALTGLAAGPFDRPVQRREERFTLQLPVTAAPARGSAGAPPPP